MNAEFTHLHVHTSFSLLDSTIRIDELIQAASDDKMEAVAITDNGNLFGALDFYFKAKEAGIKPIIGCELYIAPGDRKMKATTGSGDDELAPYATSRSGLSHIVLLVQNEIGYRNLCRLVSIGYLEGFYYKPRIDKEVLAQYSEGLIATSGCLKGELSNLCLIGDMDRASEALQWYQQAFPGRFYLEMQQNGLPQQMMINQRFQELSEKFNVPLMAAANCHYLKKEDAFLQEILMAVQTGRTLDDPHGTSVRTEEFYFKPQAVMKEDFSFCPAAIANTMVIAESCNYDFKFKDESGNKIYHFPRFDPPQGMTADEHLRQLSQEGLALRLKHKEEIDQKALTEEELAVYQARLEKELGVIINMGFTGYFLIVSDFICYAKSHDIPVGPGRGSGAGSLVAYCLKITDLDPLEHKLLFERFLNPERVSLPDFDVDFCMEKRDQVIQYVVEKYGKDCVAQIITFGKLQARGVIRDVGRSFGLLPSDVDKIAKLVPETLNITLKDAFEQEPRLRELTEKDPNLHHLFNVCRRLEGLPRHASIHAAGLVISNRPMLEHCALYRGKNDETVIQFDMNNADKIGLIKFDFLGLKTLTFLLMAEKLTRARHPEANFQLDRIPLNDKATLELLSRGDTYGIFQLESSGMQDLLRRAKPNCFEDIVAIISLYRPGPMVMLDDYIGRKNGDIPIQYAFNELAPILKDTHGIMVYQEQVQQIAMTLASYTAGGADLLRRAMGKKKPEEMAKQKAIFLEGAIKNKHDPEKADKLFELMANFAGYGFNKSHAAAYSVITCQTAFLKTHYLVEFYASLLSIERENTDKITKYIADARRHGIEVLPPQINESETDFTIISENQIRFGLGAIKGVGQAAIESVLSARQSGGAFTDLFDLCARANTRTMNKRVVEAFIKAAACDCFQIHRGSMMAAVDEALSMGTAIQKSHDDNQASFLDLLGGEDQLNLENRKVSYPDVTPWSRLQELRHEKETTGFFLTGHPLDSFQTELSRYTTTTIAGCLTLASSKEVFIGANVASLREIITKRGDRMAFATFEDTSGEMDAVIFSDVYVESEAILKSHDPIWIKATVEPGEGGNKLLMSKKTDSKLYPLPFAYETLAREVHLYMETEKDSHQTDLQNLRTALQTLKGPHGAPAFLHFHGEQTQTTLRLKQSIPLERSAIGFLRDTVGPSLRVEFR